MHSSSPSQSFSPTERSPPQLTSVHYDQSLDSGFVIEPNDVVVLRTYLKEFQNADRMARADVIGKALGEIYRCRPGNPQFDKKEATEVCTIY